MHLFSIAEKNFTRPDNLKIEGDDLIHIKKALRKKEGDNIFTTDGVFVYKCKITKVEKNSLLAKIISKKKTPGQNKIKISLSAGLTKFSHFEMVLNYATQFGVKEIYPMVTEYTQNRTVSVNRINRWEKIIYEASKQSFNPSTPVLKKIISFQEAIEHPGLNILLHPYTDNTLKDILKIKRPCKINIYIGPEAGFSENEIKLANKNKINIVKLPYNILRSETAALSLLSNTIFFFS